jgi:UMF1 family MFS transporter
VGRAEDVLTGLLARVGLGRPELRAWAMYDWANSAFWTTVIVAVFPPFFSEYAAAGLPAKVATVLPEQRTSRRGRLGSSARSRTAHRSALRRFFASSRDDGALLRPHGQWILAATPGSRTSYRALRFYDAMLPHMRAEERTASTSGFAMGFFEVLPAFDRPDPLRPAGIAGRRASAHQLCVVPGWFVFTFFFRVPEPPAIEPDERVRESGGWPSWIGGRCAARVSPGIILLVAFLYSDGIGTIIAWSSSRRSSTFRRACPSLHPAGPTIGVPSRSCSACSRTDRAKKILVALGGYLVVCAWASRMTATGVVGSARRNARRRAGARAALDPDPGHKSGEFFGLFSTLDKFAGILGPLVFGLAPSAHAAVLWVAAFFAVGAGILMLVDVGAGRRAIESAEASVQA